MNWSTKLSLFRPPWGVVAAVVATHAALFWALGNPLPHRGRGGQQVHAAMQVRHLLPDPAPGLQKQEAPREEPAERQAKPPVAGASEGQAHVDPPSKPAREAPAPASETEESAFLDYLPRSKLTAAPELLTPADVPFPEGIQGLVDLNVRITLFIDELGTVRRVRFDSGELHPAFAQAVLETFLPARYKPGEAGMVPVRSQVRLEVEFRANQRK